MPKKPPSKTGPGAAAAAAAAAAAEAAAAAADVPWDAPAEPVPLVAPVPLPAREPGDPGLEIIISSTEPPGVVLDARVLPYEGGAPFAVAVREQHKRQGLTSGHPDSPPLPNPLIPPSDTDPRADFETVQKLGEGSFGNVDKIKHRLNAETYALKTMKRLDEGRNMLLATREACIMKTLQHRNIANLYRSRLYSGQVYLFMEPCACSLFDYIRNILSKMKNSARLVKMKIAEIKYISQALLHGLAYMHGERVLHRDFKSSNILMKDHGGVKITDFGLSRKIEEETEGRRRRYTGGAGTLVTMAPEVICCASDYGFETDMWSFACVFAEMFAIKDIFHASIQGNRISALNAIIRLCGDGDLALTPDYKAANPGLLTGKPRIMQIIAPAFTDDVDASNLINKGFECKPSARMTPSQWLVEDFLSKALPIPLTSGRDASRYPFSRKK